MKFLRDHPWRINYSTDSGNPLFDFYIPALECAIKYDRKSGYFNSTILSKVASGLGALLENQGTIRLIMGCQFSPDDLNAIQQGYSVRDALSNRLDAELSPPVNLAQLKHFEILGWLIQNHYLDIRIAIPLHPNENPGQNPDHLDPNHIFHEKVGIITDGKGDSLAFSGSNNESASGWAANIESFHVFASWDGERDHQRVISELQRFDQLWNNQMPRVQVFAVPEAVQHKLIRYAPREKPAWHPSLETDHRPLASLPKPENQAPSPPLSDNTPDELIDDSAEIEAFRSLAQIHTDPGCLDFCLKSIPVNPWPHQIKILRRIAAEFPRNTLIADEVGLGKTIETGLVLRYLLISQKVKRVLILAPASVQPQWQSELREKFNLHFSSYTQGRLIDPYGESKSPAGNPWNAGSLILASSHLIRRRERMNELLAAEPWDLVVLDEAHHARRKSPQQRKDTPNCLLELMLQLRERTQSLLLLSATPMQIDAIEIFDLLNLLGLKGHWQYGDNFCNYFASLSERPDRYNVPFWQQMSVDYFNQGGKPCPRFQSQITKKDRELRYKLEEIWHQGQRMINLDRYLKDEKFIEASKQFLSTNTPIKDLMFRHTRNTLREYYKRGLLERDIPQREVFDQAIILETNREQPLYIAVSDYVRHFYRLAEQENRKALGFLMTLYRKRLTSSFYAVQKSLERRLNALLTQQSNYLTDDDLADLDDTEDAVITGLESFVQSVDPREIEYLEELLLQFDNTGDDTKLSHLNNLLGQELRNRESAIIFTQYTDTMDYLRNALQPLYGKQIGCYSGRGGELWQGGAWDKVNKEEIKRLFREGEIRILLCTDSASEGLNLQTCGVLINYDLPWNPMRVEQRIGRIDRIGQHYNTVRIHNFFYDGTVEGKVYRRLRHRINAFASVVGHLQPILARVPTFIERAVMSADPEEEDVLMLEFENIPAVHPNLEDMISKNTSIEVDADLAEIQKPLPTSAWNCQKIEQLFTNSTILTQKGIIFRKCREKVWDLIVKSYHYQVTFYPDIFDELPGLRLMTYGEPLFQQIALEFLE